MLFPDRKALIRPPFPAPIQCKILVIYCPNAQVANESGRRIGRFQSNKAGYLVGGNRWCRNVHFRILPTTHIPIDTMLLSAHCLRTALSVSACSTRLQKSIFGMAEPSSPLKNMRRSSITAILSIPMNHCGRCRRVTGRVWIMCRQPDPAKQNKLFLLRSGSKYPHTTPISEEDHDRFSTAVTKRYYVDNQNNRSFVELGRKYSQRFHWAFVDFGNTY